MGTRKELKERGKAAFQANYWRCVLVALILIFGSSLDNEYRQLYKAGTLTAAQLDAIRVRGLRRDGMLPTTVMMKNR